MFTTGLKDLVAPVLVIIIADPASICSCASSGSCHWR